MMKMEEIKKADGSNRGVALGLLTVAGLLALAIGRMVSDHGAVSARASEVAPVVSRGTAPVAPVEACLVAPEPEVAPNRLVNESPATPVAAEECRPVDMNDAAAIPVKQGGEGQKIEKGDEVWPEVALGAMRTEAPDVAVERAVLISDGLEEGKLSLVMNKSTVLSTRSAYKRVSVGSPDVADVNPIGPNNILVTAKKPGTTQLIVWDDADRSQVVDLSVQVDLAVLKDQIKQQFPVS
jgi:hypothetical protein